jgi:signal transduction histidine kinase/dsRNA-specific ribonuclease
VRTPFLGSCRIRAFEGLIPTDEARNVTDLLELQDVCARVTGFDSALSGALIHDSYLYEHPQEAPYLTPGVLRALEGLGKSWVSRELAVVVVNTLHADKVGHISATVGNAMTSFAKHVAEQEAWVATSGRYGKSLETQVPSRVRNRVFYQVAGLLCLVGAEQSLRGYVGATLQQICARPVVFDWVTLLQQTAGSLGLDWAVTRSGPDHAPTFTATCTVHSGKKASGDGTSTKSARFAAAEQMVRTHFPAALTGLSTAAQKPQQPLHVPRSDNAQFGRTVARVAAAFGLPSSATPLVAQAFLHNSWVYENRYEHSLATSQQRDNALLAFVGSHVLGYEAALSQSHSAVREATAEYAARTLESRVHLEVMRMLDLEPAVLLGRGQQPLGVPEEMGSNVFQALMAAVYLHKPVPSLLTVWPEDPAWQAAVEAIAPETALGVDASTRLQEDVAACGLVVTPEWERTGPDHRTQFVARVTVDSPVLRRRVTVKGEPRQTKTAARRATSAIVTDWFDALGSPDRLRELASNGGQARSGAAFLLRHLCAVAPDDRITPGWRRQAMLGAALEVENLGRWATEADRLLMQQPTASPDRKGSAPRVAELDVERLVRYFTLLSGGADSAPPLSSALETTLEWVAGLDLESGIDQRERRRLVDLASAFRSLGNAQQEISVADLVEGQVMLSRGLVEDATGTLTATVTPPVAAAVEAVLATLTTGRQRVSVSVAEPNELVLGRLSRPTGPIEDEPANSLGQALEATLEVWHGLGVDAVFDEQQGTVRIALPSAGRAAGSGPLATAVRRATEPQPSPIAAAVANLLHDLKNQIAAAAALIETGEQASRTAALERRLNASRHLDQAAALAERIRAASSLLRPSNTETTQLSTFLRSYASAMLMRMPTSVSLTVASGPEHLQVAISENAMTAVLDNLVKNAVEAMPSGGQVGLDWTYDDDVAVIEVSDNGPGLPARVLAAFASGGRIETTKVGGNGLGLLGVRSLLRRAGGDFELTPSPSGTVWHLTIPLADQTPTSATTTDEGPQ